PISKNTSAGPSRSEKMDPWRRCCETNEKNGVTEYWNDGVMGRKPTLQYPKPLPSYCFHTKNSRRTPSGPSKKQTLRPSGSTRSSRIFKPADLIFVTSPSKLLV